MARVITNEFQKFIDGLTATSAVYSALGTTLTFGTNLFEHIEPAVATQTITVIGFPGGPPDKDKQKYESAVQVRVKGASVQKSMETSQAIINTLHENTNVCASCNGKVTADQSAPVLLEVLEGGKWIVSVSNYTVKHIKLN